MRDRDASVTLAGLTERRGILLALRYGTLGFGQVHCVSCDCSPVGAAFRQAGRDSLVKQVSVVIAKRRALHSFKVMAKAWIVARSATSVACGSSQCQRLQVFLGCFCRPRPPRSFIVETFRLLICPIYKHD